MVKSITEKCSAKINIAIDVLGKYPNGYHEVRMTVSYTHLTLPTN